MKSLLPLILLASISVFIFTCTSDTPKPEIQSVEPYKMKSGKMVDRFEDAIINMEREDSMRTPHENELLFVGSSSIRLWKSLVIDMLPLKVINRGFGGSTIPEVNFYTNRIVLPYKAPVIVFYCGENDIADGFSPKEVKASFVEFDNIVHLYLPKTQVVYISMKPSLSRWELWDQFKEGNQLIRSYIESKPHLHYFESSESMLTSEGIPDSTIFVEDGLHMNEEGYARWTAQLKPMLMALMNVSEEVVPAE